MDRENWQRALEGVLSQFLMTYLIEFRFLYNLQYVELKRRGHFYF